MPSPPSAQAGFSESELHRQRQVAESFGTDAERYDRTRPRYPDTMVERIVAASPGWDRPYTRDEWLDQVPTFGGHSQVSPATLQELLTGLGAAIDAMGGSFTMHYTALVLTAARTGAP